MKTKIYLTVLISAMLISAVFAQVENLPIAEGKFKPTDESLAVYQCPEWFRDAKFGIWSVWGPESVPMAGDWYARKMYIEDSPAYKHHIQNYGHPSDFGYKDIIPLWKAEKWNPEELMKLYKKSGAKYFASIGVHHDNFFLWDSKLHRWNSAQMGPKKDVVGLWQQAAKKEGLYFGLTEHHVYSYHWFQTAKGADKNGDKAGAAYDGSNSEYWDLYHEPLKEGDNKPSQNGCSHSNNSQWQRKWYDQIMEAVDRYHPDLLYSDSSMPFASFGNVGRSLVAHYYNQGAKYNAGGVVYNCKEESKGRFVRDLERSVVEGIAAEPWQTDTCIGDWYYRKGQKYKTGSQVIQMLVDIVSKNGNLLLSVPLTPEGEHDAEELAVLKEIGDWLEINGEAIYGTRPWKVFGEGPTATAKHEKHWGGGIADTHSYTPEDLRFTTKENALYVFCMEKPDGDVAVKTPLNKNISAIKLLGSDETIKWTQNDNGLTIQKPAELPKFKTVVFKVK